MNEVFLFAAILIVFAGIFYFRVFKLRQEKKGGDPHAGSGVIVDAGSSKHEPADGGDGGGGDGGAD
ncbi:MAG: hypothetical protein AAFR11_00820 [Pseudomonadota bacterium]